MGLDTDGFRRYIKLMMPDLSEMDIEILLLRDMGFKWEEVAEMLHVTRRAVFKRRKKIKKICGERFPK